MFAIVGSGSVGVAFAVVFARAGFDVRCWDPFPASRERAQQDLVDRLGRLAAHGLLDEDPVVVAARVELVADLDEALDGAWMVQECAPERLDVKRSLYDRLAASTARTVPLVSSSSAITVSLLAEKCSAADRIVIGHPANPPYLLPVIEVVPGPDTRPDVVDDVLARYESVGLAPVRLRREVEGFAYNRLQGALLREAYCLVRDGVADVEDIDTLVRLGLGRRWSVVGPFETVDLNTRGGIESHAEKMGPAYERMGAERGQHDPWTPDLVELVTKQRRALMSLDEWADRVTWRDEELMKLAAGRPAHDS